VNIEIQNMVGSTAFVQYLIDKYNSNISATTNKGDMAIDLASTNGHNDFVDYLSIAGKWKCRKGELA
jgi:hypothetical protein